MNVAAFFNEDITPDLVNELARRGWYSMNVSEFDDTGMDGVNGVEWRLAGQGIDVLDEAILILTRDRSHAIFPNKQATIFLDYGSTVEDLRQVGVQNLLDLKAQVLLEQQKFALRP